MKEVFIPNEVKELEMTEIITTSRYLEYEDMLSKHYTFFLYHCIRNQMYLEKLENIFKEKKIIAGKYIENYYNYSDNCNKGEYVSLLNSFETNKISFDTFVLENISLLISPKCNAVQTKYVSYNTWEKIKNLDLKHIYSYMIGEYMCKDFIPLEYVIAVGIPYKILVEKRSIEYVNKLIEDIVLLMEKYNILLPIVDTSRFNKNLVSPSLKSNNKIKKIKK